MRQRSRVLVLTLVLLAFAPEARAASGEPTDQIVVKGATLHGKVVGLGDETVQFETIYGEGTLRIPLEDVETIRTAEPVRVYFGDGDETVSGPLMDVQGGMLVVGEDPEEQATVPVEQIRFAVPQPAYEESFLRRLRSDFREWGVELDFALDFEQGALEKNKARLTGRVSRRREPFWLTVDVTYAIDTQKLRNQPTQTTKDELSGSVLGEYTLKGKWLAWALMGGEFDKPRRVEGRLFPVAGAGYRLFDSERARLTVKLGAGYVWEDFRDSNNNDYASGYLGLDGSYTFGNGAEIRGRLGYWPSWSNADDDWLFRSELVATVPIWGPIAFRGRIININDNNPTPDTGNNKFHTIMGLALDF